MLEAILLWLTVAFVIVAVLSVAGFFVLRTLFIRTAERMSHTIDRRVGGMAAGAFTHLATYARAVGIDPAEADRRFGQQIDRFARLMDSAVRLPLIGPTVRAGGGDTAGRGWYRFQRACADVTGDTGAVSGVESQ